MNGYNSYKDSGIYYLPLLPSDWEIRKAKYLFNQEKRAPRKEDEIVTCFRDGQVTLRKNRRTEGFTNSLQEIGYQGVRKGDLVIHNMDAFAGSIGVSDSDGKGTPVYTVCTPKHNYINQYFYCYFLRVLSKQGFILSLAKGIRERSTDFRWNDFKEVYLPIPSIEEQQTIVNYIDSATSKIDAAIAREQKMIDLLEERKQIIINHAVIKGLNPNSKMKDSGIEWIGEIPERWKVKPLKSICRFGKGLQITKADLVETGLPVVSYGQIHAKYNTRTHLSDDLLRFVPTSFKKGNDSCIVRPNEFIVADTSEDLEGCGNMVFNDSDQHIYAGYHTVIIRQLKYDFPKYLAYLFTSQEWRKQIRVLVNSVKVYSITQSILKRTQILQPSVEEQKEIVAYLDTKTKNIDSAIKERTHLIDLLHERKQIIINDVVTGKVKVV